MSMMFYRGNRMPMYSAPARVEPGQPSTVYVHRCESDEFDCVDLEFRSYWMDAPDMSPVEVLDEELELDVVVGTLVRTGELYHSREKRFPLPTHSGFASSYPSFPSQRTMMLELLEDS